MTDVVDADVCLVSVEGAKFVRPFHKVVPIIGYIDKLFKLQQELGLFEEDETVHTVPCPTMTSAELDKVLAFIDHYVDEQPMVPLPKFLWSLDLTEYVQPWYADFIQGATDTDDGRSDSQKYKHALSMYHHAQTLEIQPLFDLAEVQLSILLCNKTVEEHQAMGSFDARYKPGDPEYETFRAQSMWTAFS